MRCMKLAFDERNVEYFSRLFLAEDHRSEDHTFMGLFKVLTLWSTGQYHVYVPISDEGAPMGICYGQLTFEEFHGHVYFLPEYRGKQAIEGFQYCMDQCYENFKPKRFVAYILKDNKPAKAFVRTLGFKKVNDAYIYNLGAA